MVLTATRDEEQLAEAVRLGMRGLVLKAMAPDLLVQCIRQVCAGDLWLEKHSVSSALEKLLQRESGRQATERVLTLREIEIAKQVAMGLHNLEIAKRLFISEGTVQMHIHNIYQKFEVDNRAKLTHYALEKGARVRPLKVSVSRSCATSREGMESHVTVAPAVFSLRLSRRS